MHRLEAATRDLDGAAATAIYRLSEILDQTVDPRACIAAAKVILDAVSKKAHLYNVERRLSGLERKDRAPGEGQGVDAAGAEPESAAEESTADAPHLALVSKVPGPAPSCPISQGLAPSCLRGRSGAVGRNRRRGTFSYIDARDEKTTKRGHGRRVSAIPGTLHRLRHGRR